MTMSERRRAALAASRARRKKNQGGTLTPEQERAELARWLLMGLPDPRPVRRQA